MARPPKFCQGFTDRHGRVRWYFRRKGFPRAALPGLPWSPEFMAAYELAMRAEAAPAKIGADQITRGSMDWLIVDYYKSAEWRNLADATKSTYRNMITRISKQHGSLPVKALKREHVKKMLDKMADRPAAARNWLKTLKILLHHAVEIGLRDDNPAHGIRSPKQRAGGFQTWSEKHIAQFEATHPPGSKARLALDLLLNTGQRRHDVVTMGRQHLRHGSIHLRQHKTGAEVFIPLHPDFLATLEALPKTSLTFLLTEYGRPFSIAGFGNWFRDRCAEAGLPTGLSAHGLRKAACRRLAEAGCTANQIMAISGHTSLKEVTRYTAAADRAHMARQAMQAVWDLDKPKTTTVKPKKKV